MPVRSRWGSCLDNATELNDGFSSPADIQKKEVLSRILKVCYQFQQEEAFANYKNGHAIEGDLGMPDNASRVDNRQKQREKIKNILLSYKNDGNLSVDIVINKLLKYKGPGIFM